MRFLRVARRSLSSALPARFEALKRERGMMDDAIEQIDTGAPSATPPSTRASKTTVLPSEILTIGNSQRFKTPPSSPDHRNDEPPGSKCNAVMECAVCASATIELSPRTRCSTARS